MILVLLHFQSAEMIASSRVILNSMRKDFLESQKKVSTEFGSQKCEGCQVLKLAGNTARKLVVAN